jgi:dTDP-glucose 4,6-dehydratase/UDP-glucose 4-epimerase
MNILIIGSKGFIGKYAYQYFLSCGGYECWGCDVVVDYVDPHYMLIDALNGDFNEVFEQQAFDVCINCSGAASVPDSLIHPLRDFTSNVVVVGKILEAIRRHAPSCRFINLSSAAVYGNPASLPVVETAALCPISPYGFHKLYAENMCEEFYRFYNIQSCSVRIFSAYGNGLKKQLFWDVAQQLKSDKIVILHGTGDESRDFIHVSDIIQALELILTKGSFNADHYNIANGEEITVRESTQKLQAFFGYGNRIEFAGDHRKGDPLHWRANISKLKALGYEQRVSIDEGLKNYAGWIREEGLE